MGDNRRIVKFSSPEDRLPIDKVIQTAFCDVLGGEVISVLIQIEEQWGERKVLVDRQAGADTGFSKRGVETRHSKSGGGGGGGGGGGAVSFRPDTKSGGGGLSASGPIQKAGKGLGGGCLAEEG